MERTSYCSAADPTGRQMRGSAGKDAVDRSIDDLEIHSLAEPAVAITFRLERPGIVTAVAPAHC